ncbi:MAG: bifunctional glutamate N-acetyltransferase/amino-acid acetyltransferase ArgJ, partial [Deltaproteobacteria bacterium]|nr:bifunctional glutamate N-acetyltransferase/amino-acid acetyltransferase ArgJ [Deltaproteobacteria bacterium]
MQEKEFKIPGFRFAGIHAGIKENPHKFDLGLIVSDLPCSVAGTFTPSRTKAAPVLIDIEQIKKGKTQAVLINSGNANACTGKLGLKNAREMVSETAKALGISSDHVMISSTGKIGIQLPMDKILPGIRQVASQLSETAFLDAAKSILTTDKFLKYHAVRGKIGKIEYTIAGFCKGAGMIEPAMKPASALGQKHATMLGYILTDVAISSSVLQSVFTKVVDRTFNCVTVDGDMSTNDTALILANGKAGNAPLKAGSKDLKKFEELLEEVSRYLAVKMVEDGEGATKVVELFIKNAKNEKEAKQAAYAVGRSPLVKTSFFGQDPNWGRLMAALGYSGVQF